MTGWVTYTKNAKVKGSVVPDQLVVEEEGITIFLPIETARKIAELYFRKTGNLDPLMDLVQAERVTVVSTEDYEAAVATLKGFSKIVVLRALEGILNEEAA